MKRLFLALALLLSCYSAAEAEEGSVPSSSSTTVDIMGSFDENGNFIPDDPGVRRLYEAGDFKNFIDVSLRGNGFATGIAYELTDGHTKLPFFKKRVNITTEVAVSSENLGFHVGPKIAPIIDLGIFGGVKWNFDAGKVDFTVGLQLIKLGF